MKFFELPEAFLQRMEIKIFAVSIVQRNFHALYGKMKKGIGLVVAYDKGKTFCFKKKRLEMTEFPIGKQVRRNIRYQ